MTWVELVTTVCGVFMTPGLDTHIKDVSEKYNVDKEVVLGVIHQESRCHTKAIGAAGEIGLMQISPVWHTKRAQDLGAENLLDPYSNILVGVDILSELNVSNNPKLALSIYNGGYKYPKVSETYAENVISKSEFFKLKLVES